jgi:hypothetical protein
MKGRNIWKEGKEEVKVLHSGEIDTDKGMGVKNIGKDRDRMI